MEWNILHQQTLSSVHGSDGGQLGGYSFCESYCGRASLKAKHVNQTYSLMCAFEYK